MLKDSLSQFQKDYAEVWKRYVQLHQDLDKYRGIPINEKNIKEINGVVGSLQDCFFELIDSINMVVYWYPQCTSAIKEHQKFMDDIKASGGSPEEGAKA